MLDIPRRPCQINAMRATVIGLLLLGLVLGACSGDLPRDRTIKGELETTSLAEIDAVEAVAVAPFPGRAPAPAIEDALQTSLERRRVAVIESAPLILHYVYVGTPTNIDDPDLGVGLAGGVGSSGHGDIGIGIELPLFGLFERDRSVPGTAFDLQLSLESRDGDPLWRGWAHGLARAMAPAAIARALVPLLLERLGRNTDRRGFLR